MSFSGSRLAGFLAFFGLVGAAVAPLALALPEGGDLQTFEIVNIDVTLGSGESWTITHNFTVTRNLYFVEMDGLCPYSAAIKIAHAGLSVPAQAPVSRVCTPVAGWFVGRDFPPGLYEMAGSAVGPGRLKLVITVTE